MSKPGYGTGSNNGSVKSSGKGSSGKGSSGMGSSGKGNCMKAVLSGGSVVPEQEPAAQPTMAPHASREHSLRSFVPFSSFVLFGGRGSGRGGSSSSSNSGGRGRGRGLQRDTRRIHAADDIPMVDAAICADDDDNGATVETSELHSMV